MENLPDNNAAEWADQKLSAFLSPPLDVPIDMARGMRRLRQRQAELKMLKRRNGWLLAAVAATIVLLVAVPPARTYASRCVAACVAGTNRLNQFVLAKLGRRQAKLSIQYSDRKEAPDFLLQDASGKPVQLSTFRGKVVVLNFWATWCPPCRIEIPWFTEFQRSFEDQGIAVIGVSLDEGWNAVRPYLTEQGVNYLVVIGNNDVLQAFGGLESLPTTLILDRRGRVVATHVGLVSKESYEQDIRATLSEPQ